MRLRVIFGLLISFLLLGCNPPPPPAQAPVQVTVTSPEVKDIIVTREFIGRVVATSEVQIRSNVSGLVRELAFSEGQPVKQGQLLFRIDSDALNQALQAAKAKVRDAKTALNKAELDVSRYKPLVEKGTISRSQFDAAVAIRDQAIAGLDAAAAQEEEQQIRLRDTIIDAPHDGRIGRAAVKVGALVTAGQTILATVSTTALARVDFHFSERDYLDIVRPYLERNPGANEGKGKRINVKLKLVDGSDFPDEGTLTFADRALSATTGTFALSATFPNPAEILRPGMFTRVVVPIKRAESALLLPQTAIQQVLDKYFVFVVTKDNTVEKRAIQVGNRIESQWMITSGVDAQDQVVVEGHHKIHTGTLVAPSPYQITAQN